MTAGVYTWLRAASWLSLFPWIPVLLDQFSFWYVNFCLNFLIYNLLLQFLFWSVNFCLNFLISILLVYFLVWFPNLYSVGSISIVISRAENLVESNRKYKFYKIEFETGFWWIWPLIDYDLHYWNVFILRARH